VLVKSSAANNYKQISACLECTTSLHRLKISNYETVFIVTFCDAHTTKLQLPQVKVFTNCAEVLKLLQYRSQIEGVKGWRKMRCSGWCSLAGDSALSFLECFGTAG